MQQTDNKLSNNALSVMALSSEYCRAMELAASTEPADFIKKTVRLLPRIYMAVNDLPETEFYLPDYGFEVAHLEEEYYNQVRRAIAQSLGEHDAYLETFHQDMKYSDTPIIATISEGLADIFQVLYNFVEDVRSADFDVISEHLGELRSTFSEYWSQTLCNVLRPINELYQSKALTDGSDNDPDSLNDEMPFV